MLKSLPPELSEAVEVQGRGVEKVEQAIITGVRKAQGADQAGDPSQVGAEAESGQHHHQPEEGGGASAGWAEGLEGAQPSAPEEEGAPGENGAGK